MKTIFCTLILLICACCVSNQSDHFDCDTPFSYNYYKYKVKFPMSAEEAIKVYKLVPTDYFRLYNGVYPKDADVTVYYPGFDLIDRYAARTTKSKNLYYNSDIYAVAFHLRDSTVNIREVLDKLKKDFKKEFSRKKASTSIGVYYEMRINACESVIVYNDRAFYDNFETGKVIIAFSYKFKSSDSSTFLETGGSLFRKD